MVRRSKNRYPEDPVYPTIPDKNNKFTWCDPANQSNPGTCSSNTDTVSDTAVFINALNTAGFGGFSDWRIPSTQELGTLVSYAASDPAINQTYFPLTLPAPYWTSTTSIASPESAWSVNFDDGSDSAHNYKSSFFHVLGVRGDRLLYRNRPVIAAPLWYPESGKSLTVTTLRPLVKLLVMTRSLPHGG